MTRIYNRGFRAEDASGNPIAGAQVTLWDAKIGGSQVTDGIVDMAGNPIAGGVLVCDTWGFTPDFQDTLDRTDIWAIGSLTGTITGVERILLDSSSDDTRISALESLTSGAGGLDDRLTAIEDSRGAASGIATLDGDGKVPTDQLPVIPGSGVDFNVTDFGATGDGTTNDAPAIQAALDAIAAGNAGATLTVPPGTYLINSELEIKSAIHLDLAAGATIKRGSSSMQYMVRNFNATFAPTLYAGRGNIRLSGGTWDAAGDTLTGSCTAIIFAHADRVRVENTTVRNVRDWHAIEYNSTQNGAVVGCTFEGFIAVAPNRSTSEAVQLDLALDSGTLPGIGAGAFDLTPCNNILITGCTARTSSTLNGWGRFVGSHAFSDTKFHTRIRIIGNYATGTNDYAVRAFNWQDAVVSENEFFSCNGAFQADIPTGATVETEGLVFSGNICRTMGVQNGGSAVLDYAVNFVGLTSPGSVPVREATVANNILKNIANGKGVIHFYNVADIVCAGNTIKTATGATTIGILAEGCALGTYTGNKIDGMTDRGIQIADTTDTVATSPLCTVTGNTITGCAAAGIDTNSTQTTITGNNINSSGGARAVAIWTNATNATFTGNRVVKGSGTATTGVEIRNTAVFMANHLIGWTVPTTDTGASGQDFFVNGGTAFPTAVRTYNRSA